MNGKVVAIFIASKATTEMLSWTEAKLEKGRGIVGDRYYYNIGTFSEQLKNLPDSELTLIEVEEIEKFNNLTGLNLNLGELRRNIVTEGIKLNELVGVKFYIGEVICEGIRLCEPCNHLGKLVTNQVIPHLINRGGLRAKILSNGVIRPQDKVIVDSANTP